MSEELNKSIKCDVDNCKNQKEGHCKLDCIKVSSQENSPKTKGEVDCTNFENESTT